MRAMKSPFALLILMLLALLPLGAQAHEHGAPCPDHLSGSVAPVAQHDRHREAATAAAVDAATGAEVAAPCHHRGSNDCRCKQACGAASALPLALHSPLAPHAARSEMPRHGRTVATRAPPPIDLLRPPTVLL